MIVARSFAGQKLAVFGLARSGLSSVAALCAAGAHVVAWDDAAGPRDAAAALGAEIVALSDIAWRDMAALVLAPGVPLYFPQAHSWPAAARDAGVPITGDIEIFARERAHLPAHKVVGITGTNGKSTTTALIAHLVAGSGMPVMMAGNIGVPILSQTPLPAGGVYVLELSSFQIDLLHSLSCDIAVLTNITPDHLDRHGDMAGYIAAKFRLFSLQQNGVAIIAVDDAPSQLIYEQLSGRRIAVSSSAELPGQAHWPAMQGQHNAQNAAIAIAVARELGLSDQDIAAGLESFPGLAHRMERIGDVNGVLYVNDSKATNPESTAPALSAYPRIHWIVGGRRKSDSLASCLPYLKNVCAAYTIGEATDIFYDLLAPHVPTHKCSTLARAVAAAADAAHPGDVVLLSPACASQDQFADFEVRGNSFRAAVEAMA